QHERDERTAERRPIDAVNDCQAGRENDESDGERGEQIQNEAAQMMKERCGRRRCGEVRTPALGAELHTTGIPMSARADADLKTPAAVRTEGRRAGMKAKTGSATFHTRVDSRTG